MPIPPEFIESLEFVHPKELATLHVEGKFPRGGRIMEVRNELRPADLYCYLGARFGQPNGLQSFLRADDSDNLIHWEWTLRHAGGLFSIQGHNFRTEFHLHGSIEGAIDEEDFTSELIRQVKDDFSNHGKDMGRVRGTLESWVEFVNPYQRIKRSVDKLISELDQLQLDSETDHFESIWSQNATARIPDPDRKREWAAVAERYSKGLGICFGIRSMLPVLAESYVNLLLYILMRPELKTDARLRENAIRQPIDVRIKSLGISCVGFASHPDYKTEACRKYHSLVNERNDLLHGNVVINKLEFNEVYFFGTVPIFRDYRSMWERALGVEMAAVGLDRVREEVETVQELIAYLTSCLDDDVREQVELLAERYELGLNNSTQRLGVLFPNWLVDFRAVVEPRGDV